MVKTPKINSGIMASYGVGKFLAEFLNGAFGAVVFKFYETEIGLSAGYAAVATILYSLWNAINDPVIGYVTNRKAPFSHKFGRRFPWIIIGLFTSALFFVLIFSVPESWRLEVSSKPLPVFFWMVVTICIFDGCYSLWEVNYQSVYPDKFRSQEVRTKAAAISTAVGVLGVAAGFRRDVDNHCTGLPRRQGRHGRCCRRIRHSSPLLLIWRCRQLPHQRLGGSGIHYRRNPPHHTGNLRIQGDDLKIRQTPGPIEGGTEKGTCLHTFDGPGIETP